ncbi:uncharacterized protein LOC143545222 [Bidens hawaiensis]|uniref:uncharacterized protein LOC143545222 n=1 Tax=Bidens hawaiensis TaxID=980011 RepID=UPI00404A2D3D
MAARSFLYGGDSGGSLLMTNKRVHSSSSSLIPADARSSGSRSMLSFEAGGNRSGGQFWQSYDHEDNGDDEFDEYFQQTDKKRRLTGDQVRFLEKSFESDNKLEPERKLQLAKELGLQPRQVAIWFQNRRARWKNKQLEKDYDDLQESYNKLKANYEHLVKEKEKLKSKVDELSGKIILQEKGTSDSSSSKSMSQPQHVLEDDASQNTGTGYGQNGNFTKFDNGVNTLLIDRVDSSYVFEQEQSDGSLDEENNLSKMFLPSVGDRTDPHSVSSYYLGLPGDQTFGFWSY